MVLNEKEYAMAQEKKHKFDNGRGIQGFHDIIVQINGHSIAIPGRFSDTLEEVLPSSRGKIDTFVKQKNLPALKKLILTVIAATEPKSDFSPIFISEIHENKNSLKKSLEEIAKNKSPTDYIINKFFEQNDLNACIEQISEPNQNPNQNPNRDNSLIYGLVASIAVVGAIVLAPLFPAITAAAVPVLMGALVVSMIVGMGAAAKSAEKSRLSDVSISFDKENNEKRKYYSSKMNEFKNGNELPMKDIIKCDPYYEPFENLCDSVQKKQLQKTQFPRSESNKFSNEVGRRFKPDKSVPSDDNKLEGNHKVTFSKEVERSIKKPDEDVPSDDKQRVEKSEQTHRKNSF